MENKKSANFRIEPQFSGGSATAKIDADNLARDGKVNVCLKYYQKSFECFSVWQPKELKQWSNWLEKVAARSKTDITSTTQTCHSHQGKLKKELPKGLSPDLKVYGLDVGAKQRVHGVFVDDNFYVVWLDRSHKFHQ